MVGVVVVEIVDIRASLRREEVGVGSPSAAIQPPFNSPTIPCPDHSRTRPFLALSRSCSFCPPPPPPSGSLSSLFNRQNLAPTGVDRCQTVLVFARPNPAECTSTKVEQDSPLRSLGPSRSPATTLRRCISDFPTLLRGSTSVVAYLSAISTPTYVALRVSR